MSSAYFQPALEERVVDILKSAVGVGWEATPTDWVKTWDYFLHDLDFNPRQFNKVFPYVVVTANAEQQIAPGEMGTRLEINTWTVAIYYIDIVTNFEEGRQRRAKLVHQIQKALELEPRLRNLAVTAPNDTIVTKVYDSNFSSLNFDTSGQEGYYTFISEMYLSVDTSKN
jgi:hypothetical protein